MSEMLVPLIVAIVAALPGLYAVWQGRRKGGADVAEVYERVASNVGKRLDMLQERVNTLEEQIVMYERVLDEWRTGIEKLICQLTEKGIDPVWTPPPDGDIPTRPRKAK